MDRCNYSLYHEQPNFSAWTYNAEILPESGVAITVFTFWLVSAIIGQLVPILTGTIGIHALFYTFATCTLLGYLFILKYMKETKGLTSEEIT